MICVLGVAQNDINSPYSSFGLGNLSPRTNIVSSSMGSVGYALQNPYYINFKNPAAFAAFDSLSFIADISFNIVNHQLRTEMQEQSGTFAQLGYLAIGLPILRVWRTSAGIMPYSDVGYGIIDERQHVDSFGAVTFQYRGSGGLQLLYWGNAFKISKGLTLGLNLSYLFGTINRINFAEYEMENTFNTMISDFRHLDGIYISGGVQYQTTAKEKHHIGMGVVYENAIKVWSRENLLVLNYAGRYSPNYNFDTIVVRVGDDAIRSTVKMPQVIGAGFSYGYKDRLLVAADFTWQNWKQFSMTRSKDSLRDNFITAVGVQYIPNPTSSKYHNKINFRAGTRFSSGYFIINDRPISELAVSVGLGFPIRTFNTRSSVNIMFEYSKLGTMQRNLILQNYFKLSFSFILQEKWYQRRKLE
ncbi:MAG: hypothetical protein FWC34_04475 [Bacteroidetes bacterium]|nr:hypothetical protein [Bacteroidota bacterium]